MAVAFAEVLEAALPLSAPFVTGFGVTATRRTVLVHLLDDAGHEGWGEAAALDHPYYLPETTSSAYALVAEHALPLTLAAQAVTAADAVAAMAPIRGNTFARAGVEAAYWALQAAAAGAALADQLVDRLGDQGGAGAAGRSARVPVGESIGIHPSVAATVAEAVTRVGEGYRRIKLKIQPGWDVAVVAAVREAVGPQVMLQVDANASYRLDDPADVAALQALDDYGLACVEQPLGYDDLDGHARLASRLATPVCLDETLTSPEVVVRALDLGACANVNLKPGRVGGLAAALRIEAVCRERGVPLWCGGMLESGIGRAGNLALASLPGFTDPADMSPASVLYDFDLVDPTYEVDADGFIAVPTQPGLGFTVAADRVAQVTVRRTVLRG